MAEEYPTVTHGPFFEVLNALESKDSQKIISAGNEAIAAVGCVSSALHVIADYAYLRAQHPQDSFYASDFELAETISALGDLSFCLQRALDRSQDAQLRKRSHVEFRANTETHEKEIRE